MPSRITHQEVLLLAQSLLKVGAKYSHLSIVAGLALSQREAGGYEESCRRRPSSDPFSQGTTGVTYRQALVLSECLSALRQTLQGIKVQPLHDRHKLPRAGLGRETETAVVVGIRA